MRWRPGKERPLVERFEEKVDRSGGPNACHPWTASLDRQGYGQVHAGGTDGTMLRAHRVAWSLEHGEELARAVYVDHQCHNDDLSCPGGPSCLHRRCCNVRHLRRSDHASNVRAARTALRRRARA